MLKLSLRTPDRLTKSIIEICRKLNKGKFGLGYVQTKVESDCLPSRCFDNVMSKVEKDGGRIQFGWKVFEQSNEAVVVRFHAIWISPEGTLIDITPDPLTTDKILFLADALPSLCIYLAHQDEFIAYG